uniref:ATP binding cassette subfamily A member 5 n=1 Tax=Callorhinchus milii TaxID=7868 RepID=A0A4W3JT62_CALMI
KINTQTNYSVWKDMESLQVQMMGLPSHVGADIFSHLVTSLYFVIAFVPFVNFLLINLVIEKKEVKEVMKVMGLYDSAFWLSWGLLYLVLIFILSLVMAIIATETSLFPRSSIIIIFPLLFLFGISIIPFSFLLTPLFKNQKIAGLVGSLMLMGFGLFSLPTVLVRDFPVSAVWGLCLFSPSALAIGIAQVVLLEATGDGAQPSNLSANPYPLYIPLIMLVLDSLLYLLIAAYLDQVLPGEFGQHQPFFYFLRPSYWFHRRKHYDQIDAVSEGEPSHTTGFSKVVEAVPAELKGKEAIRYEKHPQNICHSLHFRNVLQHFFSSSGLTFDVYQDQITALLGHSGTGKTTLINILSGLCPLSEGSATVFGYRVSELDELVEIRKMIGVCPQFDVLFYSLTVKEHLKILAMIKGIPSQEINNEVLGVLKELDLEAVMDVRAEKLSGGQKRKLSLGMAILGDPKVLLLDEPTAGMDPCSRQQVWTLLKKRKAGRVILLTTHFMDEADILADRKAVISQGQLKCVGSSLFLKAKFGVGYHLRMSVKESCDSDHVTSLVKRYIPNARLSQVHDLELAYTLPLEDVNKFADLFVDLDHHMDLGIDSYGVSMTSLEEVFLKLEAESEIDQTDGIANEEDFDAFDCIDHQLLTFPENNSSVLTGTPLWWQQFRTIVWLRFMNLSRERNKASSSNIDKLIHGLEAQNVEVQLFGDTELMDVAPHNAALNVSLSEEKQYLFTAVFNSTVIHSLPVLLNIISNALIISINGSGRIRAWSKPFHLTVTDADFREHVYMALAVLGLLAAALPGCYTMDNARDREIKSRSQLRLSGLFPSAYWCGYALVDIPVYFVIVAVMLGCVIAFNTTSLLHVGAGISMMLCLIGWVPAMMLFSYAYSFRFDRMQSSRDFFLISSLLVSEAELSNASQSLKMLFPVFQPYIQCVILLFVLRQLEKTYGGKSIRPDKYCRSVILPSKSKFKINTEEPENEDDDVKIERARVKEAVTCQSCEVLGLLGPNGAGKSTTISMITGDLEPSAGQVLMGDYSSEFSQKKSPVETLGYCAQVNPLWPKISVEEHLEIYAAIKGLSKEDAKDAIKRIVKALELKEHLQKPTKKVSTGIKRKLCFALCMLGNPHIVLMDEPSTGMDPKAKQFMWRAIRAAFKDRQRGAILTTHYMEEAEALCDRVAIMVSGQLRCIGTIQHLKSKYGGGYTLEMKLKDEVAELQRIAEIHEKIMQIFPHASRQESFAAMLTYKIPKEDVKSLSEAFSQLEEGKSHNTELSVFMEFAKEQESGDEDYKTIDTSFRWQQLQQNDLDPIHAVVLPT